MDSTEKPSEPRLGAPKPEDKVEPSVITPQKTDYIPPWQARANDVKDAKIRAARIAERREKGHRKYVRQQWYKRGFVASLIGLTIWFYNPHGIFVFGDPLSVGRYRSVLKDLRKNMPEEYALVKNHIDTIKINYIITGGNYAGYAQEGERGDKKITLLENTFIQGPGYAHSVLVHEACHGLQFEKDLPFSPFCENQSREHACNQWGLKVLRHFDGKPEMIAHYEGIARGNSVYGNSCLREGKLEVMPDL